MRVVIFDFDGTLTEKNGNLWKKIWSKLGYDIGEGSYYRNLLNKFLNKKITHKEWCVHTLNAYKERGFTREMLDDLVSKISLMSGVDELFYTLHSKGIEMHIVSGNIVSVIENVLGENMKYVTEVKANEFVFDESGLISDIIGTKYDHEGKANYIRELCKQKGYDPNEILFVGNSRNDEWVHKSGARTLCVNPDGTDYANSTIWNKVINTDNLMDIMKEV